MNTKYLDIVYVVKDAVYNEELRYSLRSVERNFPHNKVWFYGGKPMYFHPDKLVPVVQKGKTKWDRVRSMLKSIAEDNRITENFVLFNDDFFVMKPVENLPMYRYGTLEQLCDRIKRKNGAPTAYTNNLELTIKKLKDNNFCTWNFELHVPMVFNRGDLRELINLFPDTRGTRSLYGNLYGDEDDIEDMKDVKIYKTEEMPPFDTVFLSTDDVSFSRGKVGKLIKSIFLNKSKWEK